MWSLSRRYWLILIFLVNNTFLYAQYFDEAMPLIRSEAVEDGYLDMALFKMSAYESTMRNSIIEWCKSTCKPAHYIGITHQPTADFNIYLAFHNTISSSVKTSFEISLNYAGVMNVRNTIALRKRRP